MIDGKKLKEYKVFFVKNGYMFSDEFWSEDYITDHKFIDIIELMEKKKLSELAKKPKTSEANLNIPDVMQWVAIEDELPKNDKQVFVQWDNGRFGINEYWESDKCWKYNFDGMNIKYWCEIKPPCV